jgi:hypothetical protein
LFLVPIALRALSTRNNPPQQLSTIKQREISH